MLVGTGGVGVVGNSAEDVFCGIGKLVIGFRYNVTI